MVLQILNPEAERLARALAAELGTGVEEAVEASLRSSLEGLPGNLKNKQRHAPPNPEERERVERAMKEIAARVAALPVLDERSPDEILGYGEDGLLH